MSSAGAPVRDADGATIAALSIVWPVTRHGGATLRRHSGLVRDAAGVISRRLGYQRTGHR